MLQDHPSIKNVRVKHFKSVFSFTHTNEIEIKKIIIGRNVRKTCQLKDIPTEIIKMIADIFANFTCSHFNYFIDIDEFPQEFKNAYNTCTEEERKNVIKLITDLSAYYQTSLKFTKNWFTINSMIILIRYFYRVNVHFAKDIVLNIACHQC